MDTGDRLYGADGNDSMGGYTGDDIVDGGNGDDMVYGGDGTDQVYGGPGADEISGGLGNDRVDGGPGGDEFREPLRKRAPLAAVRGDRNGQAGRILDRVAVGIGGRHGGPAVEIELAWLAQVHLREPATDFLAD